MGRNKKRIPVEEQTHRFLKEKKAENGASTFDELLRDMSRDVFGEDPEEIDPPKLTESLQDALLGEDSKDEGRGFMEI